MSRKDLPIPHSWSFATCPQDVWPHTPDRFRYVYRMHKNELVREGVISRVGRDIVFIGERYARWLEKRNSAVQNYVIPPNRVTAEVTA